MRNLLFFDLDGTLVENATSVIPDSALEALRNAKEAGNLLFINTGRPYSELAYGITKSGLFDGFCCGLGTNIIYKGQELLHHRISSEEAKRIMDLAWELNVEVIFEGKEKVYLKPQYEFEMFDSIRQDFESDLLAIEYYPCENPDYDKFCVAVSNEHNFQTFISQLEGYDIVDRGNHFYEISPSGFSKATAIDFMCDYLASSLEDCYVFGDSVNDLSMLQHVPHSIAMGNGDAAIFEYCEYVSAPYDQGGIAEAIAHYELTSKE